MSDCISYRLSGDVDMLLAPIGHKQDDDVSLFVGGNAIRIEVNGDDYSLFAEGMSQRERAAFARVLEECITGIRVPDEGECTPAHIACMGERLNHTKRVMAVAASYELQPVR